MWFHTTYASGWMEMNKQQSAQLQRKPREGTPGAFFLLLMCYTMLYNFFLHAYYSILLHIRQVTLCYKFMLQHTAADGLSHN